MYDVSFLPFSSHCSDPKEEVTETPDISAEPIDSEPKEEVTETPDISAEPIDSESADLK